SSSRRRHTRFSRDWSSDVCSSDLGTGVDCTIRELAETIARVTGYSGEIAFDSTKPDGTPRKLLDVSRLASLGWRARIGLEQGLRDTYRWFVENQDHFRGKEAA